MRRNFIFIAVLTVVMLIIPSAGWASAGPPEGPVHLALGDSVAFGVGTPNEAKLGYNAMLNRWAHAIDCREGPEAACPGLELVNLSVPGATSASLIAGQLQPALALIADRNGDNDPDNDVILITLTIGGNDLVNPVFQNCPGPNCVPTVQAIFASYSQNLALILGSLRAAAPDAQIVMMTYYNPLGSCFRAPLAPLADVLLEGGPGVPVGFNDIIRLVAASTDVDIADTYGQLEDADFVGGEDCLHPDISGYHKIAEIFLDVID
ncbi:MAG: SGNH/GDSL hydrolase family protein [Acidimicrobiia bacterium]